MSKIEELFFVYEELKNEQSHMEETAEIERYIENQRVIQETENEIKTEIKTLKADHRSAWYIAEYSERRSVAYIPEAIREAIPEFADAVIDETVNKTKIKGLLKGGLITPAQIFEAEVVTITPAVSIKRNTTLRI